MEQDHKVDRSGWKPGPWDEEPEDRVEWRYRGFPCLIVRNHVGSWCGYVGLSPTHRWYLKDEDGIPVDVHGGLTYGRKCDGGPICHVPRDGESDEVYWIGFDTAHLGDLLPAMAAITGHASMPGYEERYWTRDAVKAEVEKLADQCVEEKQ
jgi:hypothetical protein